MSDEAAELASRPLITLSDGTCHPSIGFGTYKCGSIPASASASASSNTGEASPPARDIVSEALACGYRFLDCAQFYANEAEVGAAVADSGVARSELYLASKVWTSTIESGPEAVLAQLDRTLTDLGTEYLDLYCIHWPVPGKHVAAYKALEPLVAAGKIRSLGLSNYSVEDYQELVASGLSVSPQINQIELNPFLYRKNTVDFFRAEGVLLQSYRALRDGKQFGHPLLVSIAASHGVSTAQILGRWCVQKGFIYIPKSVKKERMEENARVFHFALKEEEMKSLDDLTTPEAIENFKGLYRKCVNRDTSKDGTLDGVKMDITND